MPRSLDRDILRLAVPALGALIAEPLLLLIDTAMVGHLGTPELAGLALAQTVLATTVGVFIFLAYATTAATARLFGAGERERGMRAGVDGMWLGLALGVLGALVLLLAGPWILTALGGQGEVLEHGVAYLRASALGLPGMLVVLSATGALRGLLDTRTPLVVALTGAALNAGLNAVLIYWAGLGITGAGLGTALAQTAMGASLVIVVARGARREGASLAPSGLGVLSAARTGAPLFLRTLSLRAAILVTVATAAALGPVTLAGNQVVNSLWSFAGFALDALAIAAQALVGHALGRGDAVAVRAVLRRCLQWGLAAGALLGLVLAAAAPLLVQVFTSDPAVQQAAAWGLVVVGVLLPLTGAVCVLDGVLIGAGDGRFLALVGLGTLAAYLPAAWAVASFAPDGAWGLLWLWVAWSGVFIGARALTNWWRARGEAWMVLGAR